jgi:SAM-dependent methyltransferase
MSDPPDSAARPAVGDPYDEVPYPSYPVEWSAPERLAVASFVHGGPRPPLDGYRVLELGCGDGANLLPLAYYRPRASFVGVDGSAIAMATAERRRAALALSNLQLIHADFRTAGERVSGTFDFILMHGVLSWVPADVRQGLLALCAGRLRPGGLLYLNYNARPGWNIRQMVRDLLLKQTAAAATDLRARAAQAQRIAATFAACFAAAGDHPYARLMERELRLVCESHASYVAHEYLAADNHAFWRSELLAIACGHGLAYVADADFNYPSGRIDPALPDRIARAGLDGDGTDVEDTVDLLSFRQLHSPILTTSPLTKIAPTSAELARLIVASCLEPIGDAHADGAASYRHPTGFEVEARTEPMRAALARLRSRWPGGLRASQLFDDVPAVGSDLMLLHAHGLIDLRLIDVGEGAPAVEPLHAREAEWSGYLTTPYHTRQTGLVKTALGD